MQVNRPSYITTNKPGNNTQRGISTANQLDETDLLLS